MSYDPDYTRLRSMIDADGPAADRIRKLAMDTMSSPIVKPLPGYDGVFCGIAGFENMWTEDLALEVFLFNAAIYDAAAECVERNSNLLVEDAARALVTRAPAYPPNVPVFRWVIAELEARGIQEDEIPLFEVWRGKDDHPPIKPTRTFMDYAWYVDSQRAYEFLPEKTAQMVADFRQKWCPSE